MDRRRDALLAAAHLVEAINIIALERAPNAVTTAGCLKSAPESRNTIPGEVSMTVDLRHPDDGDLSAMAKALETQARAISEAGGCTFELEEISYTPPIVFDESCVAAVRAAAEAGGYGHRDMISGAGHDACFMSHVAPTGMIFVPCADGISHNEIESATPEDLTAGCNVLLSTMLATAKG
jgi:N-carbamoyl-L-amino-acid hydrolase